MQYLPLTLETCAENLALDESLLDEAESLGEEFETLRLWEPAKSMAVLGRTSRATEEIQLDACAVRGVEVGRRVSGGATILAGPGCLMYAVVLSYARRPQLKKVDHAHRFVLGRLVTAIGSLVEGVVAEGTSDLAIGDRKFSGNALRMKRTHLLYHGTLLYNFPLDEVSACLKMPPRRPNYRHDRAHGDFIRNLPVEVEDLRAAIATTFEAHDLRAHWPQDRVETLIAERYGNDAWTFER